MEPTPIPKHEYMPSPLRFEFRLDPLPDVRPWGDEKLTLHWFALTQGWFWITVGETELFRYSRAAQEYWTKEYPQHAPALPYEEYYVVRYWEDLQQILPVVLDPVPDDLVRRVSNRAVWEEWRQKAWAWQEQQDNETAWDVWYAAVGWWDGRAWDAGHLVHPPHLHLWTQDDTFHLRWENRDVLVNDIPVWEAGAGEAVLPTRDFIAAALSFNDRLLTAMAERIEMLTQTGPPPRVDLDMAALQQSQVKRATWYPNALLPFTREKRRVHDWETVREAIARIERETATS